MVAPEKEGVSEKTGKPPKERSPLFPFIALQLATERLVALEAMFKRHPAPANKVGLAWGMKEASSQAGQTLAALKYYGLVDYQGSGEQRNAVLSEDARTYLRAQQDSVKKEVLRRLALKPRLIEKYFREWGADRPPDAVCLDALVLRGHFTQSAAETFLRVYDATIAYAGLGDSDKDDGANKNEEDGDESLAQEAVVGDLIQWEADGVLKLERPTAVRAVQEHLGEMWVFVEGSETGIPMAEITIVQKGAAVKPPATPPILPIPPPAQAERAAKAGMEMDRFTVDEGVVLIEFPKGMTGDSVDELEAFFELFIKKARRRAGATK